MSARYVVRKADGIEGPPIPEDEPCIVIRGQDRLALAVMDLYIAMYDELQEGDARVTIELEQHRQRLGATALRQPVSR